MSAAQKRKSDGIMQGTSTVALICQPQQSTSLMHHRHCVGPVRSKLLFCPPHLDGNSFDLVLLKLVFLVAVQAAQ